MPKKRSSKKKSKRKSGKSAKPPKADRADKYDLYQLSVQVPDYEAIFLNRVYNEAYGEPARVLREDFCGTFAICCEWVKKGQFREAIGVDLDPEPLDWGREHNLAPLKPAQKKRVTLMQADVREVAGPKADVVAAENFSWWIFKTRDELLEYFRAAHANLKKKGVFVLDLMGGSDVQVEEQEDVHKYKGFRYVWEEERFDPVSHHCRFHIHFKFKDGSALKEAFTYDWRLWSIPEGRELLLEAGFKDVHVYWEGTDPKTGEGNDIYDRVTEAPADAVWIAYLVAVK